MGSPTPPQGEPPSPYVATIDIAGSRRIVEDCEHAYSALSLVHQFVGIAVAKQKVCMAWVMHTPTNQRLMSVELIPSLDLAPVIDAPSGIDDPSGAETGAA